MNWSCPLAGPSSHKPRHPSILLGPPPRLPPPINIKSIYEKCPLVVLPSWVCLDLMSLALILAPTMWELRRSPTLNIRQSLSSRREMTACLENTSVSARLLGCEIFTNMHPTWEGEEGGRDGGGGVRGRQGGPWWGGREGEDEDEEEHKASGTVKQFDLISKRLKPKRKDP